MMKVDPDFSIVIPVRNSSTTLEVVLAGLSAQTYAQDRFECIIVDDGSTDHPEEVVARFPCLAPRLLRHPVSYGRSRARNAGVQASRGEVLLFLDCDVALSPGLLSAYRDAFEDDTVTVVSGARRNVQVDVTAQGLAASLARVLGDAPERSPTRFEPEDFARLAASGAPGVYPDRGFALVEAQLEELSRMEPQSVLCGYLFVTCNVAVRRAALLRAGGFDVSLRRAEDSDLGIRLWETGARFRCAPAASVCHLYNGPQSERFLPFEERLGFLLRNPYLQVLAMSLWGHYSLPGAAPPPNPLFASLPAIARAGWRRLAEPDFFAELLRTHGRALPLSFDLTTSELARYYCETRGIPRPAIEEYIDRMQAAGVLAQWLGDRYRYNFECCDNWLRRHTRLREFDLAHNSFPRLAKTPRQRGVTDSPEVLRCTGRYGITIHGAHLSGCEASICVPLPVETPTQTRVRIFDFRAPTPFAPPRDGIAEGIVRLERAPFEVGYSFECRIEEFTTQVVPGPEPTEAELMHRLPGAILPSAKAALASALQESGDGTLAKARAIYGWVLDSIQFGLSLLPDHAAYLTRLGACIQQTRVFVSLCRLAGIPARERFGALLSKPCSDPLTAAAVSFGFSPFLHAWAECWLPPRGWIPVSFEGRAYGSRTLTCLNVVDVELRREVERDTAMYDAYGFGCLDPYRIATSAGFATVPAYPVCKRTRGQRPDPDLLAATFHHLQCRFERETP